MQEGGERQPAAFVHFRWEEEDARPVLYCYDIQLEPRVRRKGLGGRAPHRAAYLWRFFCLSALVCRAGAEQKHPCAKPCRRFLMKLLELAARQTGMDALMLTVMDANAGARAMYARLGYAQHDSSPATEERAGYAILARRMGAAAAAPAAPLRPVTNSY